MIAAKDLLLDVSPIIDLWLGGSSGEATARLFDAAGAGQVRLWVAAGSLPTLDYVARSRMKGQGIPPERAADHVQALMNDLLQRVGVLTTHGFEQQAIYAAATDFEDAQIAATARSLPGTEPAVVTVDRQFDILGEITRLPPAEAAATVTASAEAGENETQTGDAPIPFIDLTAQQRRIRSQIEQRIEMVLRHGKYIMGPEVGELEERLAEYVGVRHCIGVSSGTDALLIALMALEVGPGDEVVTTPFSFIATAEVIQLIGATPVFVDIDPRTYNLDPTKLEEAITPKTRAVMPVSLYGQPAEFDAINAIADKHGLPVIEDAAQSFGATYKGQKSCALSTIGCTSFFPSKPLGGYGDSGACFTNDDTLAQRMRQIRVHGQDRRYHHSILGVNGRMDTLQAAIVLPKLEILDAEIRRRQAVAERYNEALWRSAETDFALKLPYIAPDRTSAYAQYTVSISDRQVVQAALKDVGIPATVHYPMGLHQQPAFAGYGHEVGDFPVSERSAEHVMSLPMHPYLDGLVIEHIASILIGTME